MTGLSWFLVLLTSLAATLGTAAIVAAVPAATRNGHGGLLLMLLALGRLNYTGVVLLIASGLGL